MLTIRLPANIETRLAQLAHKTGLTKTALVRAAILEHIDDLEDYFLAEARVRKNRKTIPLESLLAGINDNNSHKEVNFGGPMGQEAL